jgi:hypothetical protein
MNARNDHERNSRRLAWDRVEFRVPRNWELALYKFLRKGVARIEVEDEYAVRLEAEWIRPRKRLHTDAILKRYTRASRKLTLKATDKQPISGLPQGWFATRFVFRETVAAGKTAGLTVVRHELITAFHVCPRSEIFCFFLLHFLPEDREDPEEIIRLLADSFRHHGSGELVPWEVFDMAFELPRDFLLENTLFDVGAKLMIFRWKLRRFYLWHFSCADMFLKDGVVTEEWVTGYINAFSRIRGPVFFPGKNGGVTWKRRRRHFLGHVDEMVRGCFKYKVWCHRDRERNQLVVWVFNYRKEEDLQVIPRAMRFGRDIFADGG